MISPLKPRRWRRRQPEKTFPTAQEAGRAGLAWKRACCTPPSPKPGAFAFFHAELKTDKYGWLSFDFDHGEQEELQLVRWSASNRALNYWCRFCRRPHAHRSLPRARRPRRLHHPRLQALHFSG
jgi:hypothetical protein